MSAEKPRTRKSSPGKSSPRKSGPGKRGGGKGDPGKPDAGKSGPGMPAAGEPETGEAAEAPGAGARPELPPSGLADEILAGLADDAALRRPERLYALTDHLQAAGSEEAEEPEELETWVTFDLERETFALPVSHVREILRVEGITRVPDAPFPVRGITNLRGQILPVVDLRLRIGLPSTAVGEASRILVVTSRGRSLGLLVDRVHQVVRLAPSRIRTPPADVMTEQSEYLAGVYEIDGDLTILLAIDRVLLIPDSLEARGEGPSAA